MVMSSKAMDMASNKPGTASHKVMAMAETRAMDNMVVMVATKVMVIKAVMVAIRAMDKVATVATRLTVVTKVMAMRAMVATKAMAMRGMVATKAMAISLIRDTANKVMASRRDMVRTKVTAINKAVTATASSKVIQGAVTELTTDLTSHAPTMIRVMGSKETTVATRAMDSKEATVETKAMANKTTMVATRAMNSLG